MRKPKRVTSVTEHRSLIGKGELAFKLGWSRPKLDRRLKADPSFPIAQPAADGRPPRFGLAAVQAYVGDGMHGSAPAVPPCRETVAEKPLGKSALASALGWSRPMLDRRLERDGLFPVLRRGDQTGGWEFSLSDVLAYLEGRPKPEINEEPDERSQPTSMRLFDAATFALITDTCRPKGQAIADTGVRLDGLSAEEREIVGRFAEFLPRNRMDGGFESAFGAARGALAKTVGLIEDHVGAIHASMPEDIPEKAARKLWAVKFGMLGAAFDLAENMLLFGCEPSPKRETLGIVRATFDEYRSGVVDDARRLLV